MRLAPFRGRRGGGGGRLRTSLSGFLLHPVSLSLDELHWPKFICQCKVQYPFQYAIFLRIILIKVVQSKDHHRSAPKRPHTPLHGLLNNWSFYRHSGHFESYCSRYLYGMLRGQIHTDLLPEHPIMIWNNRIQNGRRIDKKGLLFFPRVWSSCQTILPRGTVALVTEKLCDREVPKRTSAR